MSYKTPTGPERLAMKACGIRPVLVLVLVLFFLASTLQLLAQPPSTTVVAGNPPITLSVVKAHIGLLEFALDTRFLTSQKDQFVTLVKTMVPAMPPAERRGFIDALELAHSLPGMNAFQQQAVRDVLLTDLEQSGSETSHDPAAKMFFLLKEKTAAPLSGNSPKTFSRQAFAAFLDYLEMCRSLNGKPAKFTVSEKTDFEKTFPKMLASLPAASQESLNRFEHTWYLLRVALKTAIPSLRQTWERDIKNFKDFPDAIKPTLWKNMMDAAKATKEPDSADIW